MLNNVVALLDAGAGGGGATSYESIATVTVGAGGSSSISFSSIPSTYKHLQLRVLVRSVQNQATPYDLTMTVNGSNPSSFAYHSLRGDGSNAFATGSTSDTVFRCITFVPNAYHTANAFGVAVIDILDYANTSKNKTLRALTGFDNNTASAPAAGQIELSSSAFFSTNAISSLELGTFGNFAQYSTAALYGVKG